MREYVIITDSCADLTQAQVDQLGVEVLPLTFTLDDVDYENYPDNRAMAPKEFFDKLRAGATTSTAAVNVAAYMTAIEEVIAQGKDVLVLAFSSGLSATFQSSNIAVEELAEKYPESQIYTVDTLRASVGEGLLVWKAAEMKKSGKSITEVRDWVTENRLNVQSWFTVDDLHHLKRGGRVSAATAMVGTMLQVKPVLTINEEGGLVSAEKARGRNSALNLLADKYGKTASQPRDMAMITHGDCLADAEKVAAKLKEEHGVAEVIINDIGPVIGAHTGPGIVALFYMGSV